MTYQVYTPTDIPKRQLSLFKENDIPKTQVTDIHMYYVSQIYTQKQELIAGEFSELIAFHKDITLLTLLDINVSLVES